MCFCLFLFFLLLLWGQTRVGGRTVGVFILPRVFISLERPFYATQQHQLDKAAVDVVVLVLFPLEKFIVFFLKGPNLNYL